MEVDLRNIGNEEDCENMKKVASRAGVQVVCSDEDEKELERDGALDLSDAEDCENMKTVASKVGMQVVCDDE